MFHCLFLLEYADIVNFHCYREGILVDTLGTAPVTAPGEVEDDVEGISIRPVVAPQPTVVVGELLLAVEYTCRTYIQQR